MHEAEQLQDFLTRYVAGELEGEVITENHPASELVNQVKLLQRKDHRAKEAWGKFCGGIRDPSRHSAEFLQEFLQSFPNSGSAPYPQRVAAPRPASGALWGQLANRRPQPPQPPPPPPMSYQAPAPYGRQKQCIEFVRHGCSLSQTFRTQWTRYRAEFGGQLNDAENYQAFVAEFAEYVGGLIQGDLDVALAGGAFTAPALEPPPPVPRKRLQPGPPVGQPPAKLLKPPPPAPGASAPGAPAARTVAIKKKLADTIRRINASGTLQQPIRLPRVAGPLAALEETTAMGILESMEELEEAIEDPNGFIVEQAMSLAK